MPSGSLELPAEPDGPSGSPDGPSASPEPAGDRPHTPPQAETDEPRTSPQAETDEPRTPPQAEGDGPRALPEFRFSRPKHLRDEVPDLPVATQGDVWLTPGALESTLVGPTVPAEGAPDGRRSRRRRTWLAAVATVVAVAAAASFALWGRPSTADGGPDLAVNGSDAFPPAFTGTDTSTAATTPTGTASTIPTPSRTPGSSRSATPPVTPAGTSSTTPAVIPPVPTSIPPAPTTPPPPPGPTRLPVIPHAGTLVATSRLCLDDWSRFTRDRNPIIVYECNGTPAQWFSFGSTGTLQVVGKCIRPAGTYSGALVALRTCDGSTASTWYFRSDGVIVNNASGLCLTSTGALVNGLPQTTTTVCTAAASQRWTFT